MYAAIQPIHASMQLKQLLAACGLPVSDIASSAPVRFFGVQSDLGLLGAVGLELHAPCALLRSLVVAPTHRGGGLGHSLAVFAEQHAAAQGIESLFLLTTTAAPFFTRLGYAMAERTDAPAAIQATTQFSGLCPASATLMRKQLCL